MRKVLITGPESSGKSFLSQKLADHFSGSFVSEYARMYLEGKLVYEEEDLINIAKGQKEQAQKMWDQSNNIVFSDTGIEVICIWSQVKYNRVNHQISGLLDLEIYDLIMVCEPNIPWEMDELREHPESRMELFDMYCDFLNQHKLPYKIINAPLTKRLSQGIEFVNQII